MFTSFVAVWFAEIFGGDQRVRRLCVCVWCGGFVWVEGFLRFGGLVWLGF